MSVAAGTRLGPYEVLGLIGAGGMGEVYRARDTRLDRTVAIKVLPTDIAADHDRRARFEREAKTIAGLSHPNICTLYDVGEHNGSTYLVMEHLQGDTLADRLLRGRMPLEQALSVATEIADALAAAHRQGIIHRDMKPGNVMLTKTGVKLLDFGLARLTGHGEQAPAARVTSVPTRSAPLTAEGVIAGTLQYMAPEQLEGKPTDARTDLWALGATLYEMVTGKRAFEGESHASIIAGILERDPMPVSALQPAMTPALDRLVRKCMRKDPEARWQSAGDVADECRWLASQVDGASSHAIAATRSLHGRWIVLTALAVTGVVAVMAVWWVRASMKVQPLPAERFSISLANTGLAPASEVAISPDGRAVVFSSTDGPTRKLYLRRLDEWESRPLNGTEDATVSSFSPDGVWLAFGSSKGLQRVPLKGGPPIPIYLDADVGQGMKSMSWDSARGIVYSTYGQRDSGVSRISADGGTPEVLVRTEERNVRYLHPQMLPSGRAVLFTIYKQGRASVAVVSLDTGKVTVLREGGSHGRYLEPSGHLVYQADGHLFGMPFDPERLEARGAVSIVADEVGNSDVLHCEYDVSRTGTLVYLPPADVKLAWRDRNGVTTPLLLEKRAKSGFVALSPDGRRAIVALAKGFARQLYVTNLDGNISLTRLTSGDDDYYGVFTPDGEQVLFTAPGDRGGYNIFSTRADAGGVPVPQTSGPSWQAAWSVRRDAAGDIFLYNDIPGEGGGGDIWQQRVGRPNTAQPIIKTAMNELGADFSPDGRWIAYYSNESGRDEVYVRGYPTGSKSRVSTEGGRNPVWNAKGGEVVYQRSAAIVAVRVVNGVRVGEPQRLFERPMYGARNWDVAPDGQRFLIAEDTRPLEINVITNWFEELKAKVPVGK